MNERIIDLQDEIKKLTDSNNSSNYKQLIAEEEINKYKNQLITKDRKIEEFKGKVKDFQKMKERY